MRNAQLNEAQTVFSRDTTTLHAPFEVVAAA